MQAFDPDAVLDRRRLKRRLAFWRGLALLAIVIAVAVAAHEFGLYPHRPYIARHTIDGFIGADEAEIAALEDLAEDGRARGLVLHVNSPGGTTTGGEALYTAIRRIAERKPTVAVMGSLATSAGYMVAIGADRVIARETTLTGSIGVLMQSVEVTRMLDKLGIAPVTIKSGPLKAVPSPFETLDEAGRKVVQEAIDDTHAWFAALVAERRGFQADKMGEIADGRIFTGRQARAAGLVDEFGGEAEALAWLESKGVAADLPVRDVKIRRPGENVIDELLGRAMARLGLARLRLDGLVSVWNPPP
ncbi:MAG: signal peptide peptidase SppA [Alphaproteobacteria bacterium]|nr:signal peptide peptidase SppA [Alphaproteobacteria bacterium]